MTPTRIEPLWLDKIGHNMWSFFSRMDGMESRVGDIYKTKTEALADLEGYAYRGGWVK
jgi:hypothetical protein